MHRAKDFIRKHAETILQEMEEHKADGSKTDFVEIIELCDGFNEVCDAIIYMHMHMDGSLYEPGTAHPHREAAHDYMKRG